MSAAQAFLVVLGGLSSLQSRANDLTLLPAQRALYVETYQSGGQVLLLCPQSCVSPGTICVPLPAPPACVPVWRFAGCCDVCWGGQFWRAAGACGFLLADAVASRAGPGGRMLTVYVRCADSVPGRRLPAVCPPVVDPDVRGAPGCTIGASGAALCEGFRSNLHLTLPSPQNLTCQHLRLVLWVQVFIFIMIMILLVMPRHLLRLKHAAMAFLVYVFVRAPCRPALAHTLLPLHGC